MGTRKEIAERAGVSVSVVSRALNNSGYVSAEKREKILKIAQELDYHPNPVAMSLMSKRTRQILFMCKDLRNAFNIELYEGMIEAAQKQNYMIVLSGEMDLARLPSLLVDGVIFPNEAIALSYLEGEGKRYFLPAVTAAYGVQNSFPRAMPRVTCDMWKASSQMADYLHRLGHRKIAFICPYGMDSADPRVRVWVDLAAQSLKKNRDRYYIGISRKSLPEDRRVLAFEEEQEDLDLPSFPPEHYFEKGSLAADIFMERELDATAVFCFNDEMAMGFCKRIRQLGLRVPEDLSVAGVDGAYTQRYFDEELTTMHLNAAQQGRKCVEVLLNVIEGRKFKYVTNIPVSLKKGATVRSISRPGKGNSRARSGQTS